MQIVVFAKESKSYVILVTSGRPSDINTFLGNPVTVDQSTLINSRGCQVLMK